MTFHRLRHPLMLWLALLIAVFGALAPVLSLATSSSRTSAQAMVEICSSSGSHWVVADASPDSPDGQGTATLSQHCPLCLHAADRVVPAPRAVYQGFGIVGEPVAPTIGQAFLFITLPAVVPPPRGPPALKTSQSIAQSPNF
jgi:hypothetical protein